MVSNVARSRMMVPDEGPFGRHVELAARTRHRHIGNSEERTTRKQGPEAKRPYGVKTPRPSNVEAPYQWFETPARKNR